MSFATTTKATYSYDTVNRLTKITDGSNLATSYAYDAASKLTSRTLPNNVVTTYTYDGLDRLTRLKDAKNNTVIADNNYTYNNAAPSRRISIRAARMLTVTMRSTGSPLPRTPARRLRLTRTTALATVSVRSAVRRIAISPSIA